MHSIVACSLGIPAGAALLAVDRVVLDTKNKPAQRLRCFYRPDH
ncbi:MAG: hypothetical protein I8H77_18695 [Comamonadaceae bacterium]|nr:hypothetical protein [Comamonadaceae bacterium]